MALRDGLKAAALSKSETPFSPSAEGAGRRSLKSVSLDLLASLGEEEAPALLQAFDDADNMTASIAALEALGASGSAGFDAALDRFYARWRANPLVIDKWFAAQASAQRPDALARVQALSAHADFNPRNPNRVRSLAAAFAIRNPRAFHAADGGGYRFLAGLAGDIDALNPALAARLLTAFESWRRFDSGRQAHAKAALEGLAARDLSPNSAARWPEDERFFRSAGAQPALTLSLRIALWKVWDSDSHRPGQTCRTHQQLKQAHPRLKRRAAPSWRSCSSLLLRSRR
ncbi:MAG TPA: aminopeptidase N C-terminal domain-containing protein, partial [Terricaulis sp.]|nr:aminopeptidase N C-terminal domain-containing protein [Terricaulis sp.]